MLEHRNRLNYEKNKHVIIVSFDARNPFPERWDCCVMVKPNQKQTKIIYKQKHRVELNMTQ